MARAALTATEDDHESNLPTSRGPATTVGILPCFWAEARAALVAAGGIPRARRGRRGGRSQQAQLARRPGG